MKCTFSRVSICTLAICLSLLNSVSGQSKAEQRIDAVKDSYMVDNGKVSMLRIIELPDMPASQIYAMIQNTLSDGNMNAKYEIVSSDDANYIIQARGFYNAFYKKKPTSKSGLGAVIDNSLKIEVKDGKARITMILNRYINGIMLTDVSAIYPINIKNEVIIGNRHVAEPKMISKNEASKYFYAAVMSGREVFENMESILKREIVNW